MFLDDEECRHAFTALRSAPDQLIRVTDGKGSVYECNVEYRDKGGARLSVKHAAAFERTAPGVRACIGMCDKEEFGGLVCDLAALGVSAITPLVCEYCQAPWWRAWDKQEIRLRNKMIAGIKQAQGSWLPSLEKPASLQDALKAAQGCPVIAADETGAPLSSVAAMSKRASFLSCFIGPPGGFSPAKMRRSRLPERMPLRYLNTVSEPSLLR